MLPPKITVVALEQAVAAPFATRQLPTSGAGNKGLSGRR